MTPFPPKPPACQDDLASVSDNDWNAFLALGSMVNHWDRPERPPGRGSYHWMLALGNRESLAERVMQDQGSLSGPGLDPSPVHSIHMTLGRVGFIDELHPRAVEVLTRLAVTPLTQHRGFELQIGPLTGSRGALRYSVAPWTPLLRVHSTLSRITRMATGHAEDLETPSFRPHVSIAYSNRVQPVGEVVDRILPLRDRETFSMHISSVELVVLYRDDRSYHYETVGQFKLGISLAD